MPRMQVLRDLKPIPAKSHYTFNLRDVSKVIQGVLMMKPSSIISKEVVAKLWCHESMRVFYDRLIDDADRTYFTQARGIPTSYLSPGSPPLARLVVCTKSELLAVCHLTSSALLLLRSDAGR